MYRKFQKNQKIENNEKTNGKTETGKTCDCAT